MRFNLDEVNKAINNNQKVITNKKKESKGKDKCEEELNIKKDLEQQKENIIEDEKKLLEELMKKVNSVGNLLHESVKVENNEDFNPVIRTWGEPKKIEMLNKPGFCHHHQILEMIDGYDAPRGQKVAKHRGYFLKGAGYLLNQALINYGMSFLLKKKYTPISTPLFMHKSYMSKTCQLSDFDDQLYKVTKSSNNDEENEFYLIATSEQPISCYYAGETLEPNQLEKPIRFAGQSTCFRKEAGAYGKETWGLFRLHQFDKIEQFAITNPEESWEELEQMISTSEEFYKSLGLSYRVVSIVSGALNDAAAKKYDLEAWFPGYNQYKELVSCSNCTDYQSRNLDIKVGIKKNFFGERIFPHMLNGTLCATQRTLTCILENYQTEEGVVVPEVLRPYVGMDLIPYVNKVPINTK